MPISLNTANGPVSIYRSREFSTLGHTDWSVRERLRLGKWTRVRQGYVVPAARREFFPETWHAIEAYAALDAQSPEWVASHWTAAVLLGIPLYNVLPQPVAVSRPARLSRTRRGRSCVHFELELDASETTVIRGTRTTTPERTLVDLCRSCDPDAAVVALDHALNRQIVDENVLEAAFFSTRRLPRIRKARAALASARSEAESPFESASRVVFARHGLPEPKLQYTIRDDRGDFVARGDFFWEGEKLVGEADGRGKYRTATGDVSLDAFTAEKAREQRLLDLGYDVIRWSPADLKKPEALVAKIRARLEARRRLLGGEK